MPETDRLQIIPLSYVQLLQYIKSDNILEEILGLATCGRTLPDDVKDMVENFTLPTIRQCSSHDLLYYTFWIVIDKHTNAIVAELGFKGPPDDAGEIEIGYDTLPGQQGKGYMTEAVSAMLVWAAEQDNIHDITAETDEHNGASIRILQKNGFQQFEKKGGMLRWKRDVRSK